MGINDPVTPNQSQEQKDKLREDLERQIKEYLEKGGEIMRQTEKKHIELMKRKKPQR